MCRAHELLVYDRVYLVRERDTGSDDLVLVHVDMRHGSTEERASCLRAEKVSLVSWPIMVHWNNVLHGTVDHGDIDSALRSLRRDGVALARWMHEKSMVGLDYQQRMNAAAAVVEEAGPLLVVIEGEVFVAVKGGLVEDGDMAYCVVLECEEAVVAVRYGDAAVIAAAAAAMDAVVDAGGVAVDLQGMDQAERKDVRRVGVVAQVQRSGHKTLVEDA